METTPIPTFAVLGVVNEGKTSVVATLSEDASARPDPTPGATAVCRAYPFRADGREVLCLYDTPGFQNAAGALAWCRAQEDRLPAGTDLLTAFRAAHRGDPDFQHEVELFRPVVEQGANILYVVDGSSPVTESYLAEMELLWRSGRPRMALINHKEADADFTGEWQQALGRFFNQTRRFNAHQATLADRLELLRDLRHMDGRPEWKAGFDQAIAAVEGERDVRRREAALAIQRLLARAVRHRVRENYDRPEDLPAARARSAAAYREDLRRFERQTHEELRDLYAQPADLEPPAAVGVDLFHASTWQTLGLTRGQLVWAAALLGALAGGTLDALVLFHSFGLGIVFGGALGAGGALLAGRRLGEVEFSASDLPGIGRWLPGGRRTSRLGGYQVEAVCRDPNLLFVLLDRALLLYRTVVRRAHARRDVIRPGVDGEGPAASITQGWTLERRKRATVYLDSLGTRPWWTEARRAKVEKDFWVELQAALQELEPARA